MKNLAILGVTGSIGTQVLDYIKYKRDEFNLSLVSFAKNINKIYEIYDNFKPKAIAINSDIDLDELKNLSDVKLFAGSMANIRAIEESDIDLALLAIPGMAAIEIFKLLCDKGSDILLANKECLVAAGDYLLDYAKSKNVNVIPVDSEHSALFSLLDNGRRKDFKKLIITASGGAFYNLNKNQIKDMKASEALKHPNWLMGAKVTIDSATLLNKGFEVIEACHLFDTDIDRVIAIGQRQSIIHAMVLFESGEYKADISKPDMRLPIARALAYPKNVDINILNDIDFMQLSSLDFFEIDESKFPAFKIVKDAFKYNRFAPLIIASADDLLVDSYIKDQIKFYDISNTFDILLSDKELTNNLNKINSYEEIINLDKLVKAKTESIICSLR